MQPTVFYSVFTVQNWTITVKSATVKDSTVLVCISQILRTFKEKLLGRSSVTFVVKVFLFFFQICSVTAKRILDLCIVCILVYLKLNLSTSSFAIRAFIVLVLQHSMCLLFHSGVFHVWPTKVLLG